MEAMELPTLESINYRAREYPAYLLRDGETGLGLFSAGFHGWNDVIHFYRADMVGTCVDLDGQKLGEMARIYPAGWRFEVEDAWGFAERAAYEERRWDVVSVDPYLGDAADRVWETLPLWLSLARRVVTVTVEGDEEPSLPSGWTHSFFLRGETPHGSNVNWLVLERA